MATKTANYELWMPDGTDDFDDFREEFNENMQTIDSNMGGGGGSSSLAGLSDVNLSSPSNNQVLKYNSTSQKWENQNESGGGSGGHTIYDPNGTAMTQRSGLQFTGGASVADDSTNDRTVITISGGGGGIIPMLAGAETLWSGSFTGAGTINVPNLDKYLVIAIQNDVSVLVIGNTFTGSGALGLYAQNNMYNYAYRFNNSVANKLTVDSNNHGLIYGSGSTYSETSWCTITKIYGLVRKDGNNAISAPIIYSDTERKVGVWRDNKPLYQRTIIGTGLSDHLDFAHGISNFETLAKADCILKAYDDSYQIPITTDQGAAEFEVTPTNIEIWLNSDFLNFLGRNGSYAITLWYTKTTDVAGSGDWTTEVPTVHYTTSEQVVGTWMGKPLYQQTIPFSGLNFSGNVDYPFDVSPYVSNPERLFFLHDMSFYIVSNVQRSFIYSLSSPVQGTNIQLRTEVNRSNASGYLTVQYTKTTD